MADPPRATPNGPEPAEPGAHGAGGDPPWDPFDAGARSAAGLDGHERQCLEWCPICRSADILRATATPEMRDQWQGIQRDALVGLRALLDSYIERLESERPSGESRVEDIPIE
jgi:hypothetical protein